MKIYTKTGDTGETSLFGKKRISKSNEIFEVLGTLDELNATLGLLSAIRIKDVNTVVKQIQNDLFSIGALIASQEYDPSKIHKLKTKTTQIEHKIDELSRNLPELKNFILPSGPKNSVYLHLARVICRRLERRLVVFFNENQDLKNEKEILLAYFNRLSDLFFVLARYVNVKLGVKDQKWISDE